MQTNGFNKLFGIISINAYLNLTGSNRYCLDKNYAGVLIIWDRMFGTFEAEKEDEEIVYGLVDQPQYFNPFKHQVRELLLFLDKEKGFRIRYFIIS